MGKLLKGGVEGPGGVRIAAFLNVGESDAVGMMRAYRAGRGDPLPKAGRPFLDRGMVESRMNVWTEAPLREVLRRVAKKVVELITVRYGNYGGPGWSGKNYRLKPVNTTDRNFFSHDLWYDMRMERVGDVALARDLNIAREVGAVRSPLPGSLLRRMEERVYRSLAATYFKWKLKRSVSDASAVSAGGPPTPGGHEVGAVLPDGRRAGDGPGTPLRTEFAPPPPTSEGGGSPSSFSRAPPEPPLFKEMSGGNLRLFDYANPGPLPDKIAETFNGSRYMQRVLQEDQILYRVHGGEAREIGRKGTFLTPDEPTGALKSKIDSALLPEWGNTAEDVTIFRIPKGTVVYEGVSSSQRGVWVGGKTQVYVRDVKPEWIVGRKGNGP